VLSLRARRMSPLLLIFSLFHRIMRNIEEVFEVLSKALEEGLPLMKDRTLLFDAVKLEDGVIYGRSLSLVPVHGSYVPEWTDLTDSVIEKIKDLESLGIEEGEWEEQFDTKKLYYRCYWCNDRICVSSDREAKALGWNSTKDPVGNVLDFCPRSDCQEGKASYEEALEQ